ncbi:MAG: cytochrome c-type biogenesis CcmF C-terminal domain-containing protein, partial [Lysobacteraceae bacterium]
MRSKLRKINGLRLFSGLDGERVARGPVRADVSGGSRTDCGVTVRRSSRACERRLPKLRAENQLDSLLSREASFLLNNLLFLGITFAIFWGTIYPLVAE